MNKKYLAPQAEITRLLVTNITTVSTEEEWNPDWDAEMNGDTVDPSDEA